MSGSVVHRQPVTLGAAAARRTAGMRRAAADQELFDVASVAVARGLHGRREAAPGGGFVPSVKPDGLGGVVDVANTEFEDLPEAWKAEFAAAAEFVVGRLMCEPNADTEEVAAAVHDDWLSRNGDRALPGQRLPYGELSEQEKAKDRAVVDLGRETIGMVRSWQARRHASRGW